MAQVEEHLPIIWDAQGSIPSTTHTHTYKHTQTHTHTHTHKVCNINFGLIFQTC
jgi:hypothetical protein